MGCECRASAGKSSFHREATLEDHLEEARKQVEETRRDDDDDEGKNRQEAARERAAKERFERVEDAI
ncbi:MAG: hypothetical protein ACI9G1_001678 [Pirellulaceae bacterium]|jgi:hypothetical protein